jgi:hypothetical protein
LWSHNNELPPIARAEKIWQVGKEIMMKGKFAPTDFAQEIRKLVEGGFLSAMSVGFQPKAEPEIDKNGNRFFPENELLEVSWVNVPALPSALVASRKMNLTLVTKELEAIQKETVSEEKAKDQNEEDDENDKPKEEDKLEDICKPKEAVSFTKESANNVISKMEEAINALKGLFEKQTPDEGISPAEDKGRDDKSVKQSNELEAELKILSMADKALEIIRHKLINKIK